MLAVVAVVPVVPDGALLEDVPVVDVDDVEDGVAASSPAVPVPVVVASCVAAGVGAGLGVATGSTASSEGGSTGSVGPASAAGAAGFVVVAGWATGCGTAAGAAATAGAGAGLVTGNTGGLTLVTAGADAARARGGRRPGVRGQMAVAHHVLGLDAAADERGGADDRGDLAGRHAGDRAAARAARRSRPCCPPRRRRRRRESPSSFAAKANGPSPAGVSAANERRTLRSAWR